MSNEVKSIKKFLGPKFGPKGTKSDQNFKFDSLAFLEVEYNDSLQKCLTSKNQEIFFWGTKFGLKLAKIRPKISFLVPFSSLVFWSFFQFWGPKFGLRRPKSCPELGFCHFLKFGELVFL